MATIRNSQAEIHQSLLTEAQFFTTSGDGDETEIDTGTEVESRTKKSTEIFSNVGAPSSSRNSTAPSSTIVRERPTTRAYQFVQLERAMVKAKLLSNRTDRVQFENEYFDALQRQTFEEYLNKYYLKIDHHYQELKRQQQIQQSKTFEFVDLEKNFLSLDPCRDVKIVFIDESRKTPMSRPTSKCSSALKQRSENVQISMDTTTEDFYRRRSRRLMNEPSHARDEITIFARRAGEKLQERLPRMLSVPHRVKILDERDTTGKLDERTIVQVKHRRALSAIHKRRQILVKMVAQTRKNRRQIGSENERNSCCGELLRQAERIEEQFRHSAVEKSELNELKSEQISTQNEKILTKKIFNEENPKKNFQSHRDALSINEIERNPKYRVIQSNRPVTAPLQTFWKNFC